MHIVHRAREILSKPADNRKQWLDRLFIVHAAFSMLVGSISFIFPHVIAYLFGEEYHHQLRFNPDAETKVRAPSFTAGQAGSSLPPLRQPELYRARCRVRWRT